MRSIFSVRYLFFLIWSYPALAASPPLNMQEGLWKTNIQVELPNGRMPFSFSSERCLSQTDPIPNTPEGKDCASEAIKIEGDSVSWTLQCFTEKGSLRGQGEILYQDKTFSGKMSIDIVEESRSASLLYHLKGEYLGPCLP